MRYEDRTSVTAMGSLQLGQQALIEGTIDHSEIKFGGRGRRSLLCHLSDNTGSVILRFFYFNKAQQNNLSVGKTLRCFGEARRGATKLEMVHPEYKVVHPGDEVIDQALTPIYPKTDGVHQTLLKKISDQVLEKINQGLLIDWLPQSIVQQKKFPDLSSALSSVHRPDKKANVFALNECKTKMQQRLVFEELVAHQLSFLQARNEIKKINAMPLPVTKDDYEKFLSFLSFDLTKAQEKVIAEIFSDIDKNHPMLRLVQGDVGSGKTVVAAAAAMAVINAGHQIAILAPTEILADQHRVNFTQWVNEDICLLLTGKDKGKLRQQKLEKILSGEAQIVIGTHALFQKDIEFNQLVLLVVDEQHRFGVHQRLSLREKGNFKGNVKTKKKNITPHQLIMTATPIPRSLAMTAYADLDYSVIDELPKGRKPVTTVVVSTARREEVIQRIKKACEEGEQAYWVCTLVEESDVLQCQAAEVAAEQLTLELKKVRVGLVHGRMKQQEKQQIVSQFKNKDID